MAAKKLKLRVRRHYRRGRRQVEDLGQQAEEHIEQHFVRRLTALLLVRRFVVVWLLLFVLLAGCVIGQTAALSGYYQTTQPVSGGIYTEGILGDFTTANPLYATSPVDTSVARLVFAGLFTYNTSNHLIGDLASNWRVDSTGKIYTVHLKPNLSWQDGQPLTAADVVYTYRTIQNPNAESPLIDNWQDIQVAAPNRLTVTFTLSNPLASFPYSLTNGIVPAHILSHIPYTNLRAAAFNVNPIGAGPFMWQSVVVQGTTPQTRQGQIVLKPFSNYNRGEPKLDQFIIRYFHNQSELIQTFEAGGLTGVAGLDDVPSNLVNEKNLNIYSFPLTAANMVFFKTTSGVLADANVRKALVQSADTDKIITGLGYPAVPVREPLLHSQLGFNAAYEQQTGNPSIGANTLEQDGWQIENNGIRYKNNQPLTFTLFSPDTPDDRYVSQSLQVQWHNIGVQVKVVYQGSLDMENTITYHTYDALLYGISIGVDPDVFSFWDSSQANLASPTHSNFSEYQDSVADTSLEAARTITNPALRKVKYQSFLQAWQNDNPALALYQPRFLYLTRQPIYGLTAHTINQATDRFNSVQNWEIRRGKVAD